MKKGIVAALAVAGLVVAGPSPLAVAGTAASRPDTAGAEIFDHASDDKDDHDHDGDGQQDHAPEDHDDDDDGKSKDDDD